MSTCVYMLLSNLELADFITLILGGRLPIVTGALTEDVYYTELKFATHKNSTMTYVFYALIKSLLAIFCRLLMTCDRTCCVFSMMPVGKVATCITVVERFGMGAREEFRRTPLFDQIILPTSKKMRKYENEVLFVCLNRLS